MSTPATDPGIVPRTTPWQQRLTWLFGALLLVRLLLPFFDSPMEHLWSDPLRHWSNGMRFWHPDLIGAGDPFLYQGWIALLQYLADGSTAFINLVCGALCALMPYGWYRALRELLPKTWALSGAILIGLWPESLGIYAYFMNETLLLSLTGFAFWATLRARRKHDSLAFAIACVLWMCASFTRTIAAPMALLCLLSVWLSQPHKWRRIPIGIAALALLAAPAAWHSNSTLHFYAPLGNMYLNEIYAESGNSTIGIEGGAAGDYQFSSPSFHNPSFYPFSDWISARGGIFHIHVNLEHGREDWRSELARAKAENVFPHWRRHLEDFVFLMFAQSWPDNDRDSFSGWLALWSRWLWLPLVAAVFWGVARRWFRGWEWLLPACGLAAFILLSVQSEDAMEGRFRKPVAPVLLAAVVMMVHRRQLQRGSLMRGH